MFRFIFSWFSLVLAQSNFEFNRDVDSTNFFTTGVGSHPINDEEIIMRDILDSGITVPYYAQRRVDDMILKCYNVIPGIRKEKDSVILDLTDPTVEREFQRFVDEVDLKARLLLPPGVSLPTHTYPMFKVLRRLIEERNLKIKAVKGEVTGPLSEAYSIIVHPIGKRLLHVEYFFNSLVNFAAELCNTLASKLGRFAHVVTGSSENAIFFVDEPLFPLVFDELGLEKTRDALEKVIKKIPVKSGIHLCSDPVSSLDFLLKLPVNYINFDCRNYKETIRLADISLLREFIEHGNGFALGLIPNTPEELVGRENGEILSDRDLDLIQYVPSVSNIVDDIEYVLEQVKEKEIDVQQFLKQSLLTPQCGFKSFTIPTPEEGERVVKELLTIQEKAATIIRNRYKVH